MVDSTKEWISLCRVEKNLKWIKRLADIDQNMRWKKVENSMISDSEKIGDQRVFIYCDNKGNQFLDSGYLGIWKWSEYLDSENQIKTRCEYCNEYQLVYIMSIRKTYSIEDIVDQLRRV